METKKPKKTKGLKTTWVEFTQIGIQMAVAITAGVLLGKWLDEKYPNSYSAYTIVFSLLGVFISLYMVIKKALRMSNFEGKQQSDEEKL